MNGDINKRYSDIEGYYNQDTDTYSIPSEFLTQGMKKDICKRIQKAKDQYRQKLDRYLTDADKQYQLERKHWSTRDDNHRIELSGNDEINHIITHISVMGTTKEKQFVRNVRDSGGVTHKQFSVICNMLQKIRRRYTPNYRNYDGDIYGDGHHAAMDTSYYGIFDN